MKENQNKKPNLITIKNKENIFLIIQHFAFNYNESKNSFLDLKKKTFSLILDLNDLNKTIQYDQCTNLQNIIRDVLGEEDDKDNNNINDYKFNIYIKNSLFDFNGNFYFKIININKLYVSDELYSISPNLNNMFASIKPKILILKKIKINSKEQLNNFFLFIYNNDKCEELILEDFFIELIIKKEKDESYNVLNQYFFYKDGKIYINNLNIPKKDTNWRDTIETKTVDTKIKNLKLIDCPLFAIKKESFINVNNYKDIIIEIDENSLLNPNIITKFKIEKGYSDICYDLDSYKLNKDVSKDYIEYLDDIFNIIIDNKDNNNFKKLQFKNYDITKYEYITGENLTFIDEKNWVLNDEEKKRKKKFEDFDEKINQIINDNLDRLSNIKELIFDNCTNYFIQLILKLIKNNESLDLLKIKKCGKEYFDLKNIVSLKIKNLILFDTPLIADHFPEENKSHLECLKGDLKIDNLTISINSLEYYCNENNLNFFKSIEIIVELINNEKLNNNVCFEMNALPIIIAFLVAKNCKYKYIPNDFKFNSNKDRETLIENSITGNISNLFNKKITIKKNNIKFSLDNFYVISPLIKDKVKEKESKYNYGKDTFEIDQDYRTFFDKCKIKEIILLDNTFSFLFENRIPISEMKNVFMNVIAIKKKFKINYKSFSNVIFNNKFNNFMEFYYPYIKFKNNITDIESNDQFSLLELTIRTLNYIKSFFGNINYCTESFTIIFDNIKERKELYCILCFWKEIKIEKNYYEKKYKFKGGKVNYIFFDKNDETKKKLANYFLKELDEEKKDQITSLNYYYTSEEEKRLFDKKPNEVINFENFKFKVEYSFNNDNKFDEFDKIENELINKMLME